LMRLIACFLSFSERELLLIVPANPVVTSNVSNRRPVVLLSMVAAEFIIVILTRVVARVK
jgi:hypothetical protein